MLLVQFAKIIQSCENSISFTVSFLCSSPAMCDNVCTCCLLQDKAAHTRDSDLQEFKLQNIVGSCDVKFPIRLEGLAFAHEKFCSVSCLTHFTTLPQYAAVVPCTGSK